MNRRNLLIGLLLASLALNLLLVGGIGWRMANAREFVQSLLPPTTGWIVRDLPELRRDELRPIVRESYDTVRPARSRMFRAQRQVNELIGSDDFDREALTRAFTQLRQSSMDYQARSHEQTIDILEQLTPAERSAASEFVRRGGSHRAGREGPRGRDLPPTQAETDPEPQ